MIAARTRVPDPAIVAELIGRSQASIAAALKSDIRAQSGPGVFDFILADIQDCGGSRPGVQLPSPM